MPGDRKTGKAELYPELLLKKNIDKFELLYFKTALKKYLPSKYNVYNVYQLKQYKTFTKESPLISILFFIVLMIPGQLRSVTIRKCLKLMVSVPLFTILSGVLTILRSISSHMNRPADLHSDIDTVYATQSLSCYCSCQVM